MDWMTSKFIQHELFVSLRSLPFLLHMNDRLYTHTKTQKRACRISNSPSWHLPSVTSNANKPPRTTQKVEILKQNAHTSGAPVRGS
jgi:hypothetical protein